MAFIDEKYLLASPAAERLYETVKELPIIDPHNHGDVKEILDNKGWDDIWEVEAATDHYVWEVMRKRGVPEEKITGSASNREKWMALAAILPETAGNAVYEWIHLDLKRRFNINDPVSKKNAGQVWETTRSLLKQPRMKPQRLLRDMKVKIMCTTDEPFSRLEHHRRAAEQIKDIRILPTWRPDKISNINKPGWKQAVRLLGEATGTDVSRLDGLLDALRKSHEHFRRQGCVASDHGMLEPLSWKVTEKSASGIYDRAVAGQAPAEREVRDFIAFLMCRYGELNLEAGWVTQIHIGAQRDYRSLLADTLGPDSGGDISTNAIEIAGNLHHFLNRFGESGKIVLYCLDPAHLPTLATIARAFPNASLGAPWWFNDSPFGMEQHLRYAAAVDLLSNHAGMVSDSRKLMSYGSRTEMFRRVLCSVIGDMEQKGRMPVSAAEGLVRKLSYERPLELFFGEERAPVHG